MISVNLVDSNEYEVFVEGETETTPRVHMSQEFYRELCGATVTHEFVLVTAFRFLLEREPNTAILAAFDLTEVSRYFPEFVTVMKDRLDR